MYYFVATDDIQHPETRELCISHGQIIPLIDLPGLCDAMGIDNVRGIFVGSDDDAYAMRETVLNDAKYGPMARFSTDELLTDVYARLLCSNAIKFVDPVQARAIANRILQDLG
jgi:hypothetical protein